jgi:hypothetical protein
MVLGIYDMRGQSRSALEGREEKKLGLERQPESILKRSFMPPSVIHEQDQANV